MWFGSLPAVIGSGANKGKPNLKEITSAKMTGTDGKKVQFGDGTYTDAENKTHVGIPGESCQFPQFGPEPTKDDKGVYAELTEDQAQQGIQEFIKDSGGAVRALENINDATAKAAVKKGEVYIRTAEDGEPAKIVQHGLQLMHDFSWAQAERISNKSVREGVDALVEEVDNLSADEIKARLKTLLGKK